MNPSRLEKTKARKETWYGPQRGRVILAAAASAGGVDRAVAVGQFGSTRLPCRRIVGAL